MTSRRSSPRWIVVRRAAAWIASAAIVSAAGCGEATDVNVVFEQLSH